MWLDRVADRLGIAVLTIQLEPDARAAAFFSQNPRTRRERRIVSHVLSVAAFQIGAPVTLIVPMESNNLSIHSLLVRTACGSGRLFLRHRIDDGP